MAWALVDSWTYSTPVANVDFIGLAGYTDVRVQIRGVSATSSGQRALQVSTNNGSTFLSTNGDYVLIDNAGVTTNATDMLFFTTFSTSARSGAIEICGFDLTAPKIAQKLNNTTTRTTIISVASALNAVRVLNSGGGNLTAGNIYVFAR